MFKSENATPRYCGRACFVAVQRAKAQCKREAERDGERRYGRVSADAAWETDPSRAPMTVRCTRCSWSADGEAREVIQRQKAHRAEAHRIDELAARILHDARQRPTAKQRQDRAAASRLALAFD